MRATRVHLALPDWAALSPGDQPTAHATLRRLPVGADGVAPWRSLYATIGGPYHWLDRNAWSDARLAEHLASGAVRVFAVDVEAPDGLLRDAGMLELERGADGRVEIVYLGLDRRAHGLGLGRWLVTEGVAQARAMGATGVWLHTCTLDGPAALPNYLARGFVVVRTEEYEATLASPVSGDRDPAGPSRDA